MSNIYRITPFMHVRDVKAAMAFFKDILGFKALPLPNQGYAFMHRDGIAIRILQSNDKDGGLPGNRRFAYYIDVEDVDAIHSEIKAGLDTLPHGDVMGPVNQPYGQRELMIIAPDGNVLVFGQEMVDMTLKSPLEP